MTTISHDARSPAFLSFSPDPLSALTPMA